ncbi:MAG: nucleotidyltransferase domain-containing protein [Spirochaetes bacterium]|nr:nucleotidyltransferase domain-containing protein [Spirochaetota bacterium]
MDIREKIRTELQNILKNTSFILAAWEGGSKASGFYDEHSDIDLLMICEENKIEEAFILLENYFEENFGIQKKYRLPEPAWHGHSQAFYKLNHTPELFFMDILIEKKSAPGEKFMEKDRHGEGYIWFDQQGFINTAPTPVETIRQKNIQAFQLATGLFWVLEADLKKQLYRGRVADSLDGYYKLLARLAVLLNLKYRPEKFDFGFRYVYRDYPIEAREKVESLLSNTSIENLETKINTASKLFYETVNELKEKFSK